MTVNHMLTQSKLIFSRLAMPLMPLLIFIVTIMIEIQGKKIV